MIRLPTRAYPPVAYLALTAMLTPGTALAAGNVLLEAAASFHGEQAEEYVGAVSGLGDVNGDGLDDFYVGAWLGGVGGGAAYLFFGRQQSWSLDTPVSAADVMIYGERPSEGVGYSRSQTPGDLDGDGLHDIVVDDIWNDEVGNNAGQVYVVFGRQSGLTAEMPVGASDASFLGESAEDYTGFFRILGDLDGDGLDDLAIGSEMCDQARGCTYLVFGSPAGWSMGQSLSAADRRYTGDHVNDIAAVLGGGGDVNGDGYDDLLVGAAGSDANGNNAGAAYLVAGRS
jgi:hypothetical protein